MLSLQRMFLFIHITKTAGTSVRVAMEDYFDRVAPLGAHAQAKDYIDVLGPRYDDFFSIGFVRNPFDRMVSLYEYSRQENDHFDHQSAKDMSFAEYVDYTLASDGKPQSDWLYADGKRRVTFVGRYETLMNDLKTICVALGLKLEIGHFNKTQRRPWQSYYTEELRAKVAAHFAEDFENFGYSTALEEQPAESLPQLNVVGDIIAQLERGMLRRSEECADHNNPDWQRNRLRKVLYTADGKLKSA